ncbi:MAG: hypothetical protein HQK96_12845 [Nitrospirae bacterium]|nr:hypothetical protein [Nitrospirota bacterium]
MKILVLSNILNEDMLLSLSQELYNKYKENVKFLHWTKNINQNIFKDYGVIVIDFTFTPDDITQKIADSFIVLEKNIEEIMIDDRLFIFICGIENNELFKIQQDDESKGMPKNNENESITEEIEKYRYSLSKPLPRNYTDLLEIMVLPINSKMSYVFNNAKNGKQNYSGELPFAPWLDYFRCVNYYYLYFDLTSETLKTIIGFPFQSYTNDKKCISFYKNVKRENKEYRIVVLPGYNINKRQTVFTSLLDICESIIEPGSILNVIIPERIRAMYETAKNMYNSANTKDEYTATIITIGRTILFILKDLSRKYAKTQFGEIKLAIYEESIAKKKINIEELNLEGDHFFDESICNAIKELLLFYNAALNEDNKIYSDIDVLSLLNILDLLINYIYYLPYKTEYLLKRRTKLIIKEV